MNTEKIIQLRNFFLGISSLIIFYACTVDSKTPSYKTTLISNYVFSDINLDGKIDLINDVRDYNNRVYAIDTLALPELSETFKKNPIMLSAPIFTDTVFFNKATDFVNSYESFMKYYDSLYSSNLHDAFKSR